jgi:hypothetical protein
VRIHPPRTLACLLAAGIIAATATSAAAQTPTTIPLPGGVDTNAPPKRDTEPVILKGSDLPAWSARSNQTFQPPLIDLTRCQSFDEDCDHNNYAQPAADTGVILGGGIATDLLLGYRYDATRKTWRQIPFQVDEVFARYLDNAASGFSVYSGEDQHTTYAYDREGFRWNSLDRDNPTCQAKPMSPTAKDPVPGLDDNDELAFMYSDAGDQAPQGTTLPNGIASDYEIRVSDPRDATVAPKYVYVMKAAPGGPKPAFDAGNGYVSYKRDSNADVFERSVSSYGGYGNAPAGRYCDADGKLVVGSDGKPKIEKRRPRDYATIRTDRYRWRYDGRWLMTQINISSDGGKTYGPDVVDRWKARAFAQDPGSKTPCCGYEEEDTNWGGSSSLLGEKVGPVRAIRETWGADSGTNVIRRETFYRYEMRQKNWLRVHVIPPLDGIYAQWDFNAGRMTKYFNSSNGDAGFDIDGSNDEAFGNFDDPCNPHFDTNDTTQVDQTYRSYYEQLGVCDLAKTLADNDPTGQSDYYHQSVDLFDPTTSKANTALEWSQTSGPWGTIVDRLTADVRDMTPGGAAQSLLATPYYRDDSCFDDGTGTDPGPKVHLRSADEPDKAADGTTRKCWKPSDGRPDGSDHFYQGAIGTHGLHLLFLVDSDNARQTVPVDEIVSEWRMAMLPGLRPDTGTPGGGDSNTPGPVPGREVGEQYGSGFQQPVSQQAQESPPNIVDRTAPTVKLKAHRHPSHHRIHLTYSVFDTGGSGLKSLTLQVKRGGKWKTIRTGVKRRSWNYKTTKSGRYAFRLRALDNAGNVSRWVYRKLTIANSRFRGPGHQH